MNPDPQHHVRLSHPPQVEVRRSTRRSRTVAARREGDRILVMLPARMSEDEEECWVGRLVAQVLDSEARREATLVAGELQDRAIRLARLWLDPFVGHEVRASEVVWVTNQRHRWGSCSPRSGRIRLSHRLQSMPDWVIDSVIVHELAHLVVHGHSESFQQLVHLYPHTDRSKAFLEGWVHGQAASSADRWDAGESAGDDESC